MNENSKSLNEDEIIHHINWDYNDNNENNLIVIPKLIHELIHVYLGYVTRDEINTLVSEYKSSKILKNKSVAFLNFKMGKLVNTNKNCELSLTCKDKIGVIPKQKKVDKINHKKLYESVYGIVKDDWDIHHIDWNHDNNEINNLIAIPKKLHFLTHKYWGYVSREEYIKLIAEFPKYPKTASVGYLNYHLVKFVDKNKNTDLARQCKTIKDTTIIRYRAEFDWRDGKNGLS
jgi:hypothetical protein